MRKEGEPKPRFQWKKTSRGALGAGAAAASSNAATSAYTAGDSVTVAVVAAIGFTIGFTAHFSGEYLKHRADDPSPVFDGPTTLLFDVAGFIVGLLLFYVPALSLDHALHPARPLPGMFGFAAMFLLIFLLPVLRGLLINLGFVRLVDNYAQTDS